MFVVDERRDEGAISWPWLLRVDRLSKRMVLLVFVFVVVVLRVVWQREHEGSTAGFGGILLCSLEASTEK